MSIENAAKYSDDGTTITYEQSVDLDGNYTTMAVDCKVTVKHGKFQLNTHKLTLIEGENYSFTIPQDVTIDCYMSSEDYPSGDVDQDIDYENSVLTITATDVGSGVLIVTYYDEDEEPICKDSCEITIVKRGIDQTEITKALGTSYQFKVNGYTKSKIISWMVENQKVVAYKALSADK